MMRNKKPAFCPSCRVAFSFTKQRRCWYCGGSLTYDPKEDEG